MTKFIDFHDIREGDHIMATHTLKDVSISREGIAHMKGRGLDGEQYWTSRDVCPIACEGDDTFELLDRVPEYPVGTYAQIDYVIGDDVLTSRVAVRKDGLWDDINAEQYVADSNVERITPITLTAKYESTWKRNR